MRWFILLACLLCSPMASWANYLLIPMDAMQTSHLKAYGVAYGLLQKNEEVQWLLNYRGGSFLSRFTDDFKQRCLFANVLYEELSDVNASTLLADIALQGVNQAAMPLRKAPKIAVYSPPNKQPWDDAVTLVLTHADIPYDIIYDADILSGALSNYQWLHLHHEDFTGEYGKFYKSYATASWYQTEVQTMEQLAHSLGFDKVSQLKLATAKVIKQYIQQGGFLFAMCAATDTYDIALAAEETDICAEVFDGDPIAADVNQKLNFDATLAFRDFKVSTNYLEYEFSDIDAGEKRQVAEENDYFVLFEFSAKYDPIPAMLCQNHDKVIKGFMGQTTAFNKQFIKPNVTVLASLPSANEARYLHGALGRGFWTFYGGHDPEDYRHMVGDAPTNLNLHPASAGYRLILNNVLFPSAEKKKQKT